MWTIKTVIKIINFLKDELNVVALEFHDNDIVTYYTIDDDIISKNFFKLLEEIDNFYIDNQS